MNFNIKRILLGDLEIKNPRNLALIESINYNNLNESKIIIRFSLIANNNNDTYLNIINDRIEIFIEDIDGNGLKINKEFNYYIYLKTINKKNHWVISIEGTPEL